jgi:hypothetical protein
MGNEFVTNNRADSHIDSEFIGKLILLVLWDLEFGECLSDYECISIWRVFLEICKDLGDFSALLFLSLLCEIVKPFLLERLYFVFFFSLDLL